MIDDNIKIMHIGQMIGGLDVYIRNTITYANEHFEYVIVHGKDDNNQPVLRKGEPIKEYQINLYRQLNPFNDLLALIQIIKLVRKERPNLIHCHSAKGGAVGRFAGFLTRTRTLYTPHAFSFLSSNSSIKKNIYLLFERLLKFDSYLLACSESERQMGVEIVGYREDHALLWSNSVPDAAKLI